MKVLNGDLSMFYIEAVHQIPQLPSDPEGKPLRQKIDKEAEHPDRQVDEKRNHMLTLTIPLCPPS
jgi:hypothetical protein